MEFNQMSWLISLLSQNPYGYTLREINDFWQDSTAYNDRPISRTTLFRARDTILNKFGILIDCEFHRNNSRYKIGNPSELRKDTMKNWLYSNLTVGNLLSDYTALKDQIMLENIPVDATHLNNILVALSKQRLIELEYQKYTSEHSSQRTVAPLALKLWQQRWYLLTAEHPDSEPTKSKRLPAFCDTLKLRTFSLNRIRNITLTDRKFRIPHDFSPQVHFSDCYGVYAGNGVKAERIVIRAYGQTPYYLRDLPLHHSQHELQSNADHTDFELLLRPTPDFLNHLLTHGTGLRVLSPAHVVKQMQDIIEKLAQAYRSED